MRADGSNVSLRADRPWRCARPAEAALFKPLGQDPHSGAVPVQEFYPVSCLVREDEQGAAFRIKPEVLVIGETSCHDKTTSKRSFLDSSMSVIPPESPEPRKTETHVGNLTRLQVTLTLSSCRMT